VRNLKYIKYVWRFYQWVMVGIAFLTFIWLMIWPSDLKARKAGFVSAIELKDIK
jgi:hypothetical protein